MPVTRCMEMRFCLCMGGSGAIPGWDKLVTVVTVILFVLAVSLACLSHLSRACPEAVPGQKARKIWAFGFLGQV